MLQEVKKLESWYWKQYLHNWFLLMFFCETHCRLYPRVLKFLFNQFFTFLYTKHRNSIVVSINSTSTFWWISMSQSSFIQKKKVFLELCVCDNVNLKMMWIKEMKFGVWPLHWNRRSKLQTKSVQSKSVCVCGNMIILKCKELDWENFIYGLYTKIVNVYTFRPNSSTGSLSVHAYNNWKRQWAKGMKFLFRKTFPKIIFNLADFCHK